jgi:MFS transporter, DHA2 family, triacylglyceride efflux pump
MATAAEERLTAGGQTGVPLRLIAAIGLCVFFMGFDQTFVVTILPEMLEDLGEFEITGLGRSAWIVNGYLLGYTVAMPLMGRVADSFGHVRIYMVSVGIFVIGTALVAAAPNLELLTGARIIQAIGGGAVVPISMAIVAETLPSAQRPLAVGAIAALDDASSLLGPFWAAALVDVVPLGWRGLFLLNIPLVLPFAFAVYRMAGRASPGTDEKVDWVGGLLLAGGLATLTLALTDNGADPRSTWINVGLGLLSLCFGVAFVMRSLHVRLPIINLSVLRRPSVAAPMGLYFIDGAATITAMVTVPLITNVLWDGSTLDGGLNLMKMLLFFPVGGVTGGYLCTRLGFRPVAFASFALASLGFFLMVSWPVPPEQWQMWGALAILGFAIGLNDAPIIGSVLESVQSGQRATAAALTQVVQTTGMIVGLALMATQGLGRFQERASDAFAESGGNPESGLIDDIAAETFQEVWLVTAIVLALSVILTLFLKAVRPERTPWSPMGGMAEELARPDGRSAAEPAG